MFGSASKPAIRSSDTPTPKTLGFVRVRHLKLQLRALMRCYDPSGLRVLIFVRRQPSQGAKAM
jgi:hypothetical protein